MFGDSEGKRNTGSHPTYLVRPKHHTLLANMSFEQIHLPLQLTIVLKYFCNITLERKSADKKKTHTHADV